MAVINQLRRDAIVRIVTNGLCKSENDLQFLNERTQRKISILMANFTDSAFTIAVYELQNSSLLK